MTLLTHMMHHLLEKVLQECNADGETEAQSQLLVKPNPCHDLGPCKGLSRHHSLPSGSLSVPRLTWVCIYPRLLCPKQGFHLADGDNSGRAGLGCLVTKGWALLYIESGNRTLLQ